MESILAIIKSIVIVFHTESGVRIPFSVATILKSFSAATHCSLEGVSLHSSDYRCVFTRYGYSVSLMNYRSMKGRFDRIPEKNKIIISLHPAFTYFGRTYGYKSLSLYKPGTEKYKKTRLHKLADYITEHKIPTIFPEHGFNDNNLKTLQAKVKKRGFNVPLAKPLFSNRYISH